VCLIKATNPFEFNASRVFGMGGGSISEHGLAGKMETGCFVSARLMRGAVDPARQPYVGT